MIFVFCLFVCVYTIHLRRGDFGTIGKEEYKILAKDLREDSPFNGKFIKCHAQFDANEINRIVVKFKVRKCKCPQNFCKALTPLAKLAQPRNYSDIIVSISSVAEMMKWCSVEMANNVIQELFKDVFIAENNNSEYIKITLIYSNKDDDDEEDTTSVEANIVTIINVIISFNNVSV